MSDYRAEMEENMHWVSLRLASWFLRAPTKLGFSFGKWKANSSIVLNEKEKVFKLLLLVYLVFSSV